MKPTHQNPFYYHRKGVERFLCRDFQSGITLFLQAHRIFNQVIYQDTYRRDLLTRAAFIVEYVPENIVDSFLKKLPEWLLDMHYEKCVGLIHRDHEAALAHWRVLIRSCDLELFRQADYLEYYRQKLRKQFIDESLLDGTEEQRQKLLKNTELILTLDPNNPSAVIIAVRGYITEMRAFLKFWENRTARKKSRMDRLIKPVHSLPKIRSCLRKSSRKLYKYLKRTASIPDAGDPREIADGYFLLSIYYFRNENDMKSIRMVRKAKKYFPDDPDIRSWLRIIRRRR